MAVAAADVAPDALALLPLAHDGWLEFNRLKWGARPEKVRLTEEGSSEPAVHAVYYLDDKGRIWKPPTSVYLPVLFQPTATTSRARLDRQWLTTGGLLAEDMKRRGVVNPVVLPPEITDVRPFQWAGFRVSVRYTFYLDLPHDPARVEGSVRRQIAKSAKAGFRWERVDGFADAFHCIAQTEQRQGFQYDVNQRDMERACDLAGEDFLRAYVCYAPDGEPASARIVLHQPSGRAIDWLVGSADKHLSSGATQYLLSNVLVDLATSGASGFDFEGANLPGVAASKAIWGGRLTPFYVVEAPCLRGLAKHARDYARFTWTRTGGKRR